jgi:hypothetical protein
MNTLHDKPHNVRLRAAFVGALVAAVGLAGTPAGAAPLSPLTKGPWLSQLGSRDVVIRTETDPPLPIVVRWGSAGDAGAFAERRESSELLHATRLDGLSPKTRYEYTVEAAGVKVTGHFTTAPSDDDEGDYRFVLYGDNRSDAIRHAAVVHSVEQEAGEFLINTGDLIGDGTNAAEWQTFFDLEGTLLRDRCLFAAIGNHELVETSGERFVRYFGGPRTMVPGKLYGTMRWGATRFVFLNGMGDWSGDDRSWLENTLTLADAEAGLRWRIVVIHDGPYASGVHGDNKDLHAGKIPAMLLRHHVDLVLSGHDHLYERGNVDGLRYVVSGGGGAPLYPVKLTRPTQRKAESTNHVVTFDVGRESIKLTAKRTDGSALDAAVLTKAGWSDDPKTPAVPVFPTPGDPSATKPSGASASGDKCGCRAAGESGADSWSAVALGLVGSAALLRRLRRVAEARRRKVD